MLHSMYGLLGAGLAGCLFVLTHAFAQSVTPRTSVIASDQVPADVRQYIDERLLEADRLRNQLAMSKALVHLLRAADWLDLAELELRLRELDAQARLVAVPVDKAADGLTARFVGSPSDLQRATKVPAFYLWIGVNGPAEAQRAMRDATSASDEENLKRLGLTGLLTPMADVYPRFEPRPDPSRIPASEDNKRLYQVLNAYVRDGHMNREAGHLVAHVVNQYLVKHGGSMKYSVNQAPDLGLVNIYVLAADPENHFRNIDCNCGYIPGTNAIVCDDKFLRQFRSMVRIGSDDAPQDLNDVIAVVNLRFSHFLLQWILGHELGHLVLDHRFDAAYFEAQPMLTLDNRVPPKVLRSFEAAADHFAMQNLSDPQDLFYAWLGLSNVVSNNYGEAIRTQHEKDGVPYEPGDIRPLAAKDKVVLRDVKGAHPPFLLRATQLANTVLELHKGKVVDTTGHFDRILANLTLAADGVPSRTMCSASGR